MDNTRSIAQIKEQLQKLDPAQCNVFLDQLKSDSRVGVQKIILAQQNALAKQQAELDRIGQLIEFDQSFERSFVAGVDEVGRGPLAGPVVAACVIMDFAKPILGINDSKKISKQKREQLYDEIINNSLFCSIGEVDNLAIDRENILNATFMAMNAAIAHLNAEMTPLNQSIDLLLVDGNQLIRNQPLPQKTVIKGDSKSYSIACASILAKVYRDRLMEKLDQQYPGYDFKQNMGYGTTSHIEGIKKIGLSAIHRKSFCSNLL